MKKIILMFVFTFNSFAGIGSSHGGSVIGSNEIKNYVQNMKTEVRSDQISFSSEAATTFVPVIDVCIEGDDYRTINKYEIYAPEKRSQKAIIGMDYLRRKIELNAENKPILKAFNVTVYKNSRKDVGEQQIIKSGKYYLPDCE